MKSNSGFTIIEMIITVAVVGIVLAIGVPGFQGIVRGNRAATEVNNLVSALALARNEAVGRGQQICVVPITPGNWNQGLQVVFDTNRNPAANGCTDGANDQVIRAFPPMQETQIAGAPASLVFRANGLITNSAALTFTITPGYCTSTNSVRQVTVSVAGIVDTENTACP